MENPKEAGALVIRHIAVLDQAEAVREEVERILWDAMVNSVETWASKAGWDVNFSELHDDRGRWIADQRWRAPPDKDSGPAAYFSLERAGSPAAYWLTSFCGASSDRVGFRWEVNVSAIAAGRKPAAAWKRLAQTLHDAEAALTRRGFELERENGSWFLPFRLDAEALVEAYLKDDFETALIPLRDALHGLEDTVELFTQILDRARVELPGASSTPLSTVGR